MIIEDSSSFSGCVGLAAALRLGRIQSRSVTSQRSGVLVMSDRSNSNRVHRTIQRISARAL